MPGKGKDKSKMRAKCRNSNNPHPCDGPGQREADIPPNPSLWEPAAKGRSCSTFAQLCKGQGTARPQNTGVSELPAWKMSQNTTLFLQICTSVGKSLDQIKQKEQISADGAPWSGRLGAQDKGPGGREGQRKYLSCKTAEVSCMTTYLLWTQRATSSPAAAKNNPPPHP